MCSSHSVSEGEASNFEVPPGCHRAGGSAYIEILSQSLLPAWTFFFLVCLIGIGVTQLFLYLFLRKLFHP